MDLDQESYKCRRQFKMNGESFGHEIEIGTESNPRASVLPLPFPYQEGPSLQHHHATCNYKLQHRIQTIEFLFYGLYSIQAPTPPLPPAPQNITNLLLRLLENWDLALILVVV
jgi:hypothetical protein